MQSHNNIPLQREPTHKDLVRALAYATNNDNLLLQMENGEVEITTDFIRKNLQQLVKGSKERAWRLNAFIAATGNVSIAGISPLINSMTNLSDFQKNLLAGSASISGAALMLVLGSQLEKSSGKDLIVWFRILSLLGTVGLLVATATTEPNDIDFYAALFLNAAAGASTTSFMLSNNVISWSHMRELGAILAKYASLAGIAPAITLLGLQLSKDYLSLPAAFGITSAISLVGTLATYFGVKESPYHQLLALGIEDRYAKPLAKIAGQEKFPVPIQDGYLPTLFRTARSIDALALSASACSSYGAYLLMTTSLYLTLMQILNYKSDIAVYVTAAFSCATMLTRYTTGPVMDKFDKTQGFLTFLTGMACIIVSSIMQATNRQSPSEAYALGTQALQALGIGISAAGAFKLLVKWSQGNRFPIGVMSAFSASIGQLSGFGLNAIAAGIVSRDESDKYFNTYWLIAALALTGTLLVMLGERNNKTPISRTFANAYAGCFSRNNPANADALPVAAPIPMGNLANSSR